MKHEITLQAAIQHLKKMLEDYRRVFGEKHKAVLALEKVIKYVEALQ